MEIKDKIIRKFKDIKNNNYEIRKKHNGHCYLIIIENGKNFGRIINGSKKEIFDILNEIHKNTNFIEL